MSSDRTPKTRSVWPTLRIANRKNWRESKPCPSQLSLTAHEWLFCIQWSILMPISHLRYALRRRQSCLVLSVLAVWTELATIIQDSFVLPTLCRQFPIMSFVLSQPSFQFATVQSLIYWGQHLLNTILTCRQLSSHRWHGRDKTVLSCPCRRCELGVSAYYNERTLCCSVIKLSQPQMNSAMLVGCIICFSCIILNGIDGKFVAKTSLSFFCHVR